MGCDLEKTNYNLFLNDTDTNISYACVYHPDDAGVKLVFTNKYNDSILESFGANSKVEIFNHILKYGCEIEHCTSGDLIVSRFFELPINFQLVFIAI